MHRMLGSVFDRVGRRGVEADNGADASLLGNHHLMGILLAFVFIPQRLV